MTKHAFLTTFAIAFLLLFSPGCSKVESESHKPVTEIKVETHESVTEAKSEVYKFITGEEALRFIESEKDFVILDVRTLEEYQDGHIPNAINIPLDDIEGQLQKLPDKEQAILVYCTSGSKSRKASEKLVNMGYTNIIEISGINSWPGEIEK